MTAPFPDTPPKSARFSFSSFATAVPISGSIQFVVPSLICAYEKTDEYGSTNVANRIGYTGQKGQLIHRGIFDTGASCSVISEKLAHDFDLIEVGRCSVITASAVVEQPLHLVNFFLPNNTFVPIRTVTAAPLVGVGFLLGMDVISLGDVSIVSRHNCLVLTFTMYHLENIPIPPPDNLPTGEPI